MNVGVLGAGRWGVNLIRCFGALEHCHVEAICDTDRNRLLDRPTPHTRISTNPVTFLRDPGLQAIVVATPAPLHAEHAISALEAGKHVFVEKPMALSLGDACRIRDAARRNQRQLMVGHVLRYHPAIAELRKLLDGGALGRVKRVVAVRFGTLSSGEGPWWSLAPHDISVIRYLLGEEVVEVSALRSEVGDGRAEVTARLHLARCSAELVVSTARAAKVRRLVMVGTEGAAVFDDGTAPSLKWASDGAELLDCSLDDLTKTDLSSARALDRNFRGIPVPDVEPLATEARHFVSAVLGGGRIATDAEEGCRVVAALEAGETSWQTGGEWTRVPTTPAERRARHLEQECAQ